MPTRLWDMYLDSTQPPDPWVDFEPLQDEPWDNRLLPGWVTFWAWPLHPNSSDYAGVGVSASGRWSCTCAIQQTFGGRCVHIAEVTTALRSGDLPDRR